MPIGKSVPLFSVQSGDLCHQMDSGPGANFTPGLTGGHQLQQRLTRSVNMFGALRIDEMDHKEKHIEVGAPEGDEHLRGQVKVTVDEPHREETVDRSKDCEEREKHLPIDTIDTRKEEQGAHRLTPEMHVTCQIEASRFALRMRSWSNAAKQLRELAPFEEEGSQKGETETEVECIAVGVPTM